MLVILATWEADTRTTVGGVVQVVKHLPSKSKTKFKPQCWKKKKEDQGFRPTPGK
jgi:hypothetical protein